MSGGSNLERRNLVMDAPKTLWGAFPLGAVSGAAINAGSLAKVASGALTANTYKQVLNLTGPGVISCLGLTSEDDNGGAGRTLSVQVVLDGVTVVDAAAPMAIGGASTISVIGSIQGGLQLINPQPVGFRKSCVVSIKSTVTETNKSNLLCAYRLC